MTTQTVDKILDAFKNYTILNPHITMNITLSGKQSSFPQVQKFKSNWNNLDSVYHYSYKEFENLIISLRNDSITLYDFVKHIRLREASKLSKDEWNIPIIEIQHDKLLIRKLYDNLKKLANPREKLELPYDMRIKFRKKAIIERLNQWGIEVENIKYQLYNGNFKSEDEEVQFPYLFEVAEIKTVNHKHEIISGINSTPVKLESMENPDLFRWTSKGKDWTTSLISIILEEKCGYSRDDVKFKKPNTIVFMHLVSPRINWKGYGKVQIDFIPFHDLGDWIYNVCKGGTRDGRLKGRVTQIELLRNILLERYNAVQQNPRILIDDRWTPSDVWYGVRPQLLENRIKITPNTRSNLTAEIREICEREISVNMEELGIFAADRAQLYFNGYWHDVGFDDLHSLKHKGTDLIIIEKEGMAEALTPLADKHGLALLFTRGFATKYVRDLSELSKDAGCNTCVLSDYDASGILLASKLKVLRIGIDPKTIKYFNLERDEVDEPYEPKNHKSKIRSLVSDEEFEYLSHRRIEINSIKTKVGSEKFQKWVIDQLDEHFLTRNYNRAIEVPTMVKPNDLKELYAKIENELESYIKSESVKEVEELTDIVGFIDNVAQKRIDIEEGLKQLVTDNSKYQDLMHKFNQLVESHPFFNGRDKR